MQSSSSPSSHHHHHSVGQLSSASTVTTPDGTAGTAADGRRRRRERAKTESASIRPAADDPADLPHPQLGSITTAHTSPLHLDLASLAKKSPRSTKPRPPSITPSAPIPIPASRSKEDVDCPITPLSARGDGHRFPLGRSLKPRYMSSPDHSRHVNYISDSSDSSLGSTKKSQRDTPRSPLSPTMPLSQRFFLGEESSPQPTALRLPPLPRFHPANFESPSPGSTTTHPRSSKANAHGRQYSDAQQQIHKYQRDIVTTRAARLTLSPKATISPSSPRLGPMGSPGPVTPLMLESEGDYLMARDTASPFSKKYNGRDMVERLVQKENERIHARTAESLSPAVSPAGGPQ